jgi:FkbM family methyltransferase
MRTPKRWLVDQFKTRFSRQMWRLIAPHWRVKSGVMLELSSEADWIIYNDIFVDGEYDQPILGMLDAASRGPLQVVDIGANVGFFSLRVLDLARTRAQAAPELRICAVEGAPRTYATLRRRLAFSGCGDAVRAHHGLIGRRSGAGQLFQADNHGLSSVKPVANATGVSGAFIDLESLLEPGVPIALLKCDIEGSEELFIASYPELWPRVERAVFELHHDLCDTARCRSMLAAAGLSRQTEIRSFDNYAVVMFERPTMPAA